MISYTGRGRGAARGGVRLARPARGDVRLTPPWHPVRVLAESGSLRDGQAVLGLPGRVRWVAQHQPDGYDPPRRFDGRTGVPTAAEPSGGDTSTSSARSARRNRVTDTVDTNVPRALLRPMFAYRKRELAGDLAAHRWGATLAGRTAPGGDHRARPVWWEPPWPPF